MGILQRAVNLWKWSGWRPKDYFEWTGTRWATPDNKSHGGFTKVGIDLGPRAEFLMPNRTQEVFNNGGNLDDAIQP